MGGFAEALAADIRLDSSRAARELGWKPGSSFARRRVIGYDGDLDVGTSLDIGQIYKPWRRSMTPSTRGSERARVASTSRCGNELQAFGVCFVFALSLGNVRPTSPAAMAMCGVLFLVGIICIGVFTNAISARYLRDY